ncbi:uncharacterized protein LOC121424793 [Lytechinus variegatus]|uniref:uncharacterized protein LOC121424793 n=1 Tax=Lytechinus variegatus TaxID=7654 RepID=UPI001BB1D9F0|nr:uncharacterized protein LOC121424793 [Lytechinus variegatus]
MVNGSYNSTTTAAREANSNNGNRIYRGCVSRAFQVTGILHIVAGALSIVFGIAAIVLKAFASYVAIPIWGGLLIYITTGCLGVSNFCKPKSKKIVIAYLVMSTISAIFAFLMIITFGIFLASDDNSWDIFICHPLPLSYCESNSWSRMLIDGLLIFISFLEVACGATSASMACYKACKCCRRCCRACTDDPGNSNMVYFAANMGGTPMMAVPNTQCSRPIYVPSGMPGNASQPGQFVYLAPNRQAQSYVTMPVGAQQSQSIPQLSPPPQYQQSPQQQQVQQAVQNPQQSSGLPSGQVDFNQVQAAGQMQPQGLTQSQSVPEKQSLEQPQVAGVGQQVSGPQPGNVGNVQGQMQPQVLAPTQQLQHPQQAGMAPAMSGPPQVGFVQVQGPGGQIQMIPAQALYPQVMMVQAPQQQSAPAPQPAQPLGPTQQPVKQVTAPTMSAEDQAEEAASEPVDIPSGQVSSGQFSDDAALI